MVSENISKYVKIYPNPTEGKVEIIIGGLKEKITGRVFDLCNKEYLRFEMDGARGNAKQLNLSAFPSGVYLISITGGPFRIVKKVVVL